MTRESKPVVVNGIRYKPQGCAAGAFSAMFDLPMMGESPEREWLEQRADAFIAAMPPWVAHDTVAACEALAARVRARHPDHVPPTAGTEGDDGG